MSQQGLFLLTRPEVKDKWGIRSCLSLEVVEHELRQVAHQQKTIAALIGAVGGKVNRAPAADPLKAIRPGGNVSTRSAAHTWVTTHAAR